MTIQVRKGGAWQSLTGIKVYKGGAWRRLVAVKVYAGGAWRTVAKFSTPVSSGSTGGTGNGGGGTGGTGGGAITVSISPTEAGGGGTSVSQTSPLVTATPHGGVAPYTYAWTSTISTPTAPTLASTKFTTSLAPGQEKIGTGTCVVTDSLGTTASASISLDFERAE